MAAEVRVVELRDGTRLWTAASGSGPPVIACHGGPGLWDYLAPLAAMLEDQLRIVRFDQRGCGRSGGDGPYTIDQAVTDLDEVRSAYGFDEVAVLGHSWGAELALRYAGVHAVRTRSVAYVAGVGADDSFRAEFAAEFTRRLGTDLDRWRELSTLEHRTPEQEHEFCLLQWRPDFSPSHDAAAHAEELWATRPPGAVVNVRANRELWADRVSADLLSLAPTVTAPVLMMFGADDPRPWSASNPVRAALRQVRHVVIDRAGHAPWVEQPERALENLVGTLRP